MCCFNAFCFRAGCKPMLHYGFAERDAAFPMCQRCYPSAKISSVSYNRLMRLADGERLASMD
ncbi:MAG: hypothetical protein ACK4I8_10945 [Armatimonadota bacterium]